MATAVEGPVAGAVSSGDFGNDCNGEDSNGEGALELDALPAATAGDSLFLHAAKLIVSTLNNNPDNTSLKFTIVTPNSYTDNRHAARNDARATAKSTRESPSIHY